MSKITINDIAKAAGVAKSTVSKVLNDAASISDETKRKVRDIMKEMNYTPSSIATQLARQSSFNVGLLIDLSRKDDFLNHFFYAIIGGIESVIGKHQYELTICNASSESSSQQDSPAFMNRLVRNGKVDGLIMDSSIWTAETERLLAELQFPYVLIGDAPAEVTYSAVDIDNENGGRLLAAHLIERGYRRLAFIGGEGAGEPLFDRRVGGCANALREHGLTFDPRLVMAGTANEATGRLFMEQLLALPAEEQPDAVICMNNYTAFGALAAAHAAGVSIPTQLGIATFDDYPLAPYTNPPLTCLKMDTFELGVQAAQMLMTRISEPALSAEQRLIPAALITRASTDR
ncbi:LacI family transcriptional regulator [Paenibacillus cellulosilyticus]|uniref:LacI family transcriptional regulator n=1 Tax=Paenibacillus cellulosilyticus TaxID=375489 RepID=A0A2V2Z0D8_9BACL|nr:LacI family DNA-binding transcriptional regulator [Paenibacillus cellulosilyticus]PWW05668.1 LacI family transcriptional regulator [Paenibacillus cellulosilyticus]QKS45309.1 LacI family DNA-binding transcriptional regulator [Paenibacillus cellulosilyticus]